MAKALAREDDMTETKSPLGADISRRDFLTGLGSVVALTAVASTVRPVLGQDVLLEAPQLAEMVARGELPPLAERLPANAVVVEAVDGVGQYGGTWTSATTGAADGAWWWRTTGYEGLTRVNIASGQIDPNVAESWDYEDEGRVYVFKIREGIKWSDGEPFTAHDVAFWYNDFLLNNEVWAAGPPFWMRTSSGPGTVEARDDLTVVFTFQEPNGFLPSRLATDLGNPVTAMPRHYLSRFHAGHNADAASLAQQEGFNTWVDMFLNKAGQSTMFITAGLPVIRPWQIQSVLGQGTRLTFARNPYYWKTDTNGSQLPYIDQVIFDVIEDPQVMLLKAANGEFGYHLRHINSPANKPVLAQSMQAGNYTLMDLQPATMNEGVIGFNLTHADPVKREIYNNKNFRIGLSHALNRTEIINAVYQRQGQPWQAAPRPESIFYNERLATQYLEYDVDLANEYLDEAGYERNAQGQRIGPDGNPIHIQFIASTTGGAQEALLIDVQQIIKQQWAQVGISIDTTPMERSLYQTRTENGEQDALMWTGFGGHELTLRVDPRWYLPTVLNQANWANQWTLWFNSNGQNGEEPIAPIKRQFELYRDAMATPDDAERDDLFREILEIAADEFFVIGTTLSLPTYAIKANNFHNVPVQQPDCWPYPSPGQVHCEQFWISQS
jgi:peptide/nickel transport system substrate-binding protein